MEEVNVKSWIGQPDVCRFCLSTNGCWDLTTAYISDTGINEVYANMMLECYGISISHLTEWGPSRLVCAPCAGQLRNANNFKKQVIQSEERFIQYCQDLGTVQIKLETENDFGDAGSYYDDPKDSNLEQNRPSKKRKKRKIITKCDRKRNNIELDDSDTPIAELSRKNEPTCPDLKTDTSMETFVKENEAEVDCDRVVFASGCDPPSKIKQISERKRVVLTCSTVLRDTTACPFRHHKSWFQCFFCTLSFMEINSLRKHTLDAHNDLDTELKHMKRYPRSLQIEISNLKCRSCHLSLTDVDAMRGHLEKVHDKVIYKECIADYKVDSSPYSCHICNQEFHVFRTLTTHLNEHYANCICDVCGRSFINSKRLKVHKRTHENGIYPCPECGKILKTKTSKANHMETHSKRVVKCQICFEPMKHYNDRIKHMSEVHNITHKFKCPICGREYNIKHYLATHIRQTHGNKNKKCSECEMAFITNHGLKKHMLKHSGVKPFSCDVCNKSYARSYTLRDHMRTHEGDGICAGQ